MNNTKGFTLLELMIVISIIAVLISATFFPFSYYMTRARVEKNIDMIGQEWVATHKDVRNGILEGERHATLDIEMGIGSGNIDIYAYSDATSLKKRIRSIEFDHPIIVLGFTGSAGNTSKYIRYTIAPPFATGAFSLDGASAKYLSGVIMTIGYPGVATSGGGRSRDILLRPYYD